ncbi:uncharacterized protein ASPGLDRAFT_36066 [Aspergillus glaucus CBS 516.65]|uniref:Uncharacterized protein n=1 Tax=Aspergillus glaucus CBS 516.65 TaxID=1160497 RepID=A0A1L9VJH7_ASPGL|nr:hypothetical protein ASPGLDRAFT_36066 [Aspergillus glaucus CBS 516.65]OJJ84077.1 hypothetical protein ASPGLDRAFT_36066 [Aspergillus glaucus CBS 516.65]
MQAGAILAQENKDLRAANEKKKQKRARSKRQITHQGSLSMEDAQQVIRGLNQPSEVEIVTQMAAAAPAISPSQRPARRPPMCSLCGNLALKQLLGQMKADPKNETIETVWSDDLDKSAQKTANKSDDITTTLQKVRNLAVFINASPQC